MDAELSRLLDLLNSARALSGEGSHARQLPRRESLPVLGECLKALRAYLTAHDQSAEAWRLLSEAEECLLHYGAAREALERAMALSGKRDRKLLKQLALLRERERKWTGLRLPPVQLKALFRFLEAELDDCDHSGAPLVRQWLERERVADVDAAIAGMGADLERDNVCDCKIDSRLRHELES